MTSAEIKKYLRIAVYLVDAEGEIYTPILDRWAAELRKAEMREAATMAVRMEARA
ncbi:MAG: hypothetical protein AAFQ51_05350 [Pseudomonadota bacterium]